MLSSGMPVTVTLEKPALPTLWLDTSVVIKLTKIKRGEALQPIEVERGTRLQKFVFDLVGAGKLLCPESDQAGKTSMIVRGQHCPGPEKVVRDNFFVHLAFERRPLPLAAAGKWNQRLLQRLTVH